MKTRAFSPYPPTPAPWHVEERDSEILRDGKPVRYYSVAHTSERRDMFVALNVAPTEIFFSVTGATSPNLEGEANARLIAQSPALLAALQAIDAAYDSSAAHGHPIASPLYSAIMDARRLLAVNGWTNPRSRSEVLSAE